MSNVSSPSRRPAEPDPFLESADYTAEISHKMRVPKHITAAGNIKSIWLATRVIILFLSKAMKLKGMIIGLGLEISRRSLRCTSQTES